MSTDLDALRELRAGVAQWLIDITDTIADTIGDPDIGFASNIAALAATGEELTRQAWAIRNHTTETAGSRIGRLHTERAATIASRAGA